MLAHIGKFHYFDPDTRLTCGIDGCTSTFRKFESFRSHFYRKHSGQAGRDVHVQAEEEPEVEEFNMDDVDVKSQSLEGQCAAAKFLLMIKEGRRLSQQAVTDISSGAVELLKSNLYEVRTFYCVLCVQPDSDCMVC